MPQLVSSASAVCSVCGASLSANDTCVACLLRAGLEDVAPDSTTFGDYEIATHDDGSLWELGRGAMGVTYRATDTVLQRTVALKVIERPISGADSRAVRERFLREARAAAALRHPNIAGVFQFGASPELDRCYCAMELVDGETLEARVRREGPLSVALALNIATQITLALIAAAERGLIHRDLKPGNIMLSRGAENGRLEVKVIDFGLAKVATDTAAEMELTHGGFVGTPAFASPEQFAGEHIDARSDIYALGVTLWFALTARLPFHGSSIAEIRERQADGALPVEQLRARAVPAPVIELLRACLARNPAERPASARELMRRLEICQRLAWNRRRRKIALVTLVCVATAIAAVVGAFSMRTSAESAASPMNATVLEKGVAVLPFENLTAEGGDAFLAAGLREDLSTSLGKIKQLKVIGRTSVMDYPEAGRAGNLREIGRSLGVSHLLTGSVRQSRDRVVVSVALIDAQNEHQLWSQRYERTLSDTLSLQGELALEIASALQATLTPLENTIATAKLTDNAEAYLLYLRGREIDIAGGGADGNDPRPFELYRRAIALDPGFAVARARLSLWANGVSYANGDVQLMALARKEAEEAVRLRPDLGEARLAMTHCYLYQDQDYDRALNELKRAAELLPNSSEVPMTAAFIYKRQLRFRDRIAAFRRAEELDPRNRTVAALLTLTLRWVREWSQAIDASKRRAILPAAPVYVASPWTQASDEFRLTGDIGSLKRAAVAESASNSPFSSARVSYAQFEIAMFERDYAAAAAFLTEVPPDAFDQALSGMTSHSKQFHEALLAVAQNAPGREAALRRIGDSAGAPTTAKSSRRDINIHAEVALVHALLGDNRAAADALSQAEDYKHPGSVEQNGIRSVLALVYAWTGETEKALDLIEHLLTVPTELQAGAIYNMTLVDLKWRWVWDPLRDHPRFQKLLAGPEPKTIY